jgi:hypothetical protein
MAVLVSGVAILFSPPPYRQFTADFFFYLLSVSLSLSLLGFRASLGPWFTRTQ